MINLNNNITIKDLLINDNVLIMESATLFEKFTKISPFSWISACPPFARKSKPFSFSSSTASIASFLEFTKYNFSLPSPRSLKLA